MVRPLSGASGGWKYYTDWQNVAAVINVARVTVPLITSPAWSGRYGQFSPREEVRTDRRGSGVRIYLEIETTLPKLFHLAILPAAKHQISRSPENTRLLFYFWFVFVCDDRL